MASKFKFWLAVILAVGFLFFCDAYLGEYSLGIVNNIAIFITLAISYNLINHLFSQEVLMAQRYTLKDVMGDPCT